MLCGLWSRDGNAAPDVPQPDQLRTDPQAHPHPHRGVQQRFDACMYVLRDASHGTRRATILGQLE